MLVGKPEEKSPLGRPRRRWEDNIKMDLHEVGGGAGDWMELTQDSCYRIIETDVLFSFLSVVFISTAYCLS
jgi:hypothetical protein